MTARTDVVWTLVLCGAVLLAGGLSGARSPARSKTRPATQPQGGAEQIAKINQILSRLRPRDPKSEQAAENALSALPKAYLPAMKKVLSAQKDPLRRGVLDSAVVRLEWGVDPRRAVSEWIDKNVKKPPAARLARLKRLADEALLLALSEVRFTSLLFRRWPVARESPAPLKSNNIFVISPSSPVQHLTNLKQLGRLYTKHLPAMKTHQAKQQAARAWLCLSRELQSDGMFVFKVRIGGVSTNKSDGTSRVVAKATVQPKAGDRGWIRATLTFDREGRLTDIREQTRLTPGLHRPPS